MGKRGAPLGNQYGRKHGLYSKFLTETEKAELDGVDGVHGMEDEISLLRIKLCRILESQPDRFDLQIKAVNMIDRLVRTRHSITCRDKT